MAAEGRDRRRATPRRDAGPSGRWGKAVPIAVACLVAAIALGLLARGLATPKDPVRDEYVRVWGERIDAFNAGYPLEGYGDVFAAAAYDYGIDPRFSPAIARVESTSGQHCFLPHNAWGWGNASWPDWGTAIYSHVELLAAGYGSTLDYEDARRYNPETTNEWYDQVSMYMEQIWPDDGM